MKKRASASASLQGSSELAMEVAASCAVGDHTHLGRNVARAGFGFAQLIISSLVNVGRPLHEPAVDGGIGFVVANPVAHGARLVQAVHENIRSGQVTMIADGRFAEPFLPVSVSSPGISPRSLRSIVTLGRLKFAISLRVSLPSSTLLRGSSSRLYNEYLFFAQAIRYFAIYGVISRSSASTVILTDFDRSAYGRPWVWAANTRGLETATLMHASPNEANYVPVLANHALVWGEVQRAWIEAKSPHTHAIIIGRPEISSRPGSSEAAERLLVCHSQEALSLIESRDLVSEIQRFRARGLFITLRLHPTATEATLDERWAAIARIADDVTGGFTSFPSSVWPSDVVLCVTSSSAVEAVVSGIPTIIIADDSRVLPADLAAIRASTPDMLRVLHSEKSDLIASTLESLAGRLVAAHGERAGARLADVLTALHNDAARKCEL